MSRCRLFSGSLIARNAGGRGLSSATARHKSAAYRRTSPPPAAGGGSFATHFQSETRVLVFTIKLAAGKGVGKDFMQNLLRADLDNGLKGGGEILAIAVEDWRTVTHGRLTQWRMTANREFMIKPPTAQRLRTRDTSGKRCGSPS